MVGTILPFVYGERQQGKRAVALWFHTAGYAVGAAATGCLLGILGAALPLHALHLDREILALSAPGAVSMLYSVCEMGLVQVPAPQFYRQVPENWRFQFRPRLAALLYGFGLGVGLGTRIPVTTFYVVVLWAILNGSPFLGALGIATFGFGRALPLLCMAPFVDSSDAAVRFESLYRFKPVVRVLNGIALGFAGSCLLFAALLRQ
jgi:cytochrome c biogenesis protein CcdA